MSSTNVRKLFKAFTDDATPHAGMPVAKPGVSSAEIRALFKAFSDNPALHAAVRACKSPAEKHGVIRKAGLTPVTDVQVKVELAKCLLGEVLSPEDEEFLNSFIHLAVADSASNNDA